MMIGGLCVYLAVGIGLVWLQDDGWYYRAPEELFFMGLTMVAWPLVFTLVGLGCLVECFLSWRRSRRSRRRKVPRSTGELVDVRKVLEG